METPSLLRGSFYETSLCAKCPRFHPCTITKKCQNYDRHRLDCSICEARVHPTPQDLGGYLPEGELMPDLQHCVKMIDDSLNTPFAHPDSPSQNVNAQDIADKYNKTRQAIDMFEKFNSIMPMKMEEAVAEFMVSDEFKEDLLGRIK